MRSYMYIGLKEKDKILIRAEKSCQTTLDLRGHNLSILPQCVYQKPLIYSLNYLELSYNDFQEVPHEISLLVNLQELYIQNNEVQHIPETFGNLTNLRRLGLSRNRLQEVPFLFSRLLNLVWVNLSGNLLEFIPPFLASLPKLSHLYVICNPIQNIPREIYVQGLKVIREFFQIEVNGVKALNDSNENKCGHNIRKRQRAFVNKIPQQCMRLKPVYLDTRTKFHGDVKQRKDVFLRRHTQLVTKLEKSQRDQLDLVKDLKQRIRINQNIRRMNLEYLEKKNCGLPRARRISVSSLVSGVKEHRESHRCMTTSEYGTLSTSSTIHYFSHDELNNFENTENSGDTTIEDEDRSPSYYPDWKDVPSRERHIINGNIRVIIPECNLSGHLQSEFFLEILEDLAYQPSLRGREVVASEIVKMEPHGAIFYQSDPAIISLPIDVKVTCTQQIVCLCSNTVYGQKLNWQAMKRSFYDVFETHVEIRTEHFSLFAVLAQKQYPSAQRLIRKGVGGCLLVAEVPGVEVDFQETSLLYDIEASIKVLYADEPYDVDHDNPLACGLASPVVEVGPNGCEFDSSSTDLVIVRLPLPNGKEIMDKFGDQQLTFWCSSTSENEPLNWQPFTPKMTYIDTGESSLCSVYFSVEHFTFFRVLWDIVDAVLYEAKLSASYFLPVFQFYISCQALMSESEDGLRFGLCVACSRFGKPLEGIGNFPIPIGNNPPKMISTGPLIIRVISGLFESDTAAGQQEILVHKERFTGRQIVAQFICRFTGEAISYGSFGRVEIEQPVDDNNCAPKLLFSFNLDKPRDAVPYQSSLAWNVLLSKELVALVTITTERDMGDEVWQELARALRYTNVEMNRIASSADPMTELLANYKRRGGQPHEFISAMYSIGQNKTSSSLIKSAGTSGINAIISQESHGNKTEISPCLKKNLRKRKLPEEISLEDKFSEVTRKVLGKWKELGRVLKMNENHLREIEQDFKQDGVREQAYQMLLAWQEKYPDDCTLTALSGALCKIELGNVARQCCMVEMG